MRGLGALRGRPAARRRPDRAERRARRRQDDVHPGAGRWARGPRCGHVADVRDRPGAPVARSGDRRWCTSTPTGSAGSTSSTTSTSTPRSTQAVTVVEWGEGLAEGLSESRLEVQIVRGDGWTWTTSTAAWRSRRSGRAGTHSRSGGSDDRVHRPRQRHPLRRAARCPGASRGGRGAPAGAGPPARRAPRVRRHRRPRTAREYAVARTVLDSWTGPQLVGTGNHDVREAFARGLLDADAAPDPLVQVLEAADFRILMLDSLVRRLPASGSTTGALARPARLARRTAGQRRPAGVRLPAPSTGRHRCGPDGADPARQPESLEQMLMKHPHVSPRWSATPTPPARRRSPAGRC